MAVLPAMGDASEWLRELARAVSDAPDPRELDMLVTTGARTSCALCAMALLDLGHRAVSLTGSQAGIITDTRHGQAAVVDVRSDRVREALDEGAIVLVAARQGVSTESEVTALRGGTVDETAAALTAALGAELAHPRRVPERSWLRILVSASSVPRVQSAPSRFARSQSADTRTSAHSRRLARAGSGCPTATRSSSSRRRRPTRSAQEISTSACSPWGRRQAARQPHAATAGAACVDKSSAYRLVDGYPLVVPEVNGARALESLERDRIVANPNCCTIPLTCVLKPLHERAGLVRVRVATYQSVSGAGAQRMQQLRDEPSGEHDLVMDWSRRRTSRTRRRSSAPRPARSWSCPTCRSRRPVSACR